MKKAVIVLVFVAVLFSVSVHSVERVINVCGNTICEKTGPDETCYNCPVDCGFCCGNGACESGYNEDCRDCPQDCGTCPTPNPFCGDHICSGDEGCGSCPNDCGGCPPPSYCGDGQCSSDECYGRLLSEPGMTCPEDCGSTNCPPPYPLPCNTSNPNWGNCWLSEILEALSGIKSLIIDLFDSYAPDQCSACGGDEVCVDGECRTVTCDNSSECTYLGAGFSCCPTQGLNSSQQSGSAGTQGCIIDNYSLTSTETGRECGGEGGGCGNGVCNDLEDPINCPADCEPLKACINVLTDSENCGSCGNVCASGASCDGGVCRCPVGTFSCGGRCTNYSVDPSNCGGCSASGSVLRGENCLEKTKPVAGESVPAPEACWGAPGSPNAYGTCGVFQCNPDAGNPCGTLGSTDYKCCRNSDSSVFACTSVNSQASVVNCGACGNACGQGGNAGRPFCVPSS